MPASTSNSPAMRRLVTDTTALPVSGGGSKAGILDASLRLFAEKGYAGASMRDIAAAANLKPASIYAHFKSKEEILARLIDLGHEEHHQSLCKAIEESETSPKEQLRAWVGAHVRFHANYSMLALLVNHELSSLSEEFISHARELREQSINMVMNIVRDGANNGDFNIGHDPWLAGAAIGAMGMRVANWYSEHHEQPLDAIVAAYQDFACRLCGTE